MFTAQGIVNPKRIEFDKIHRSEFYGNLVESEGNHYASYLLMAKKIDESEKQKRLEFFLDLDNPLIKVGLCLKYLPFEPQL